MHEAYSGFFAFGERAAWLRAHREYITEIMRLATSACRDMATDPMPLLLFTLDGSRYALQLSAVERVLPLVEIAPLPGAPAMVSGVIDCHGHLLPVINMRRRFGLAERPAMLSDQLVVAHTIRRTVALLVDTTLNVITIQSREMVDASEILSGLGQSDGVLKMDNGLVVIHNLTSVLSLDEEGRLDAAMGAASAD